MAPPPHRTRVLIPHHLRPVYDQFMSVWRDLALGADADAACRVLISCLDSLPNDYEEHIVEARKRLVSRETVTAEFLLELENLVLEAYGVGTGVRVSLGLEHEGTIGYHHYTPRGPERRRRREARV